MAKVWTSDIATTALEASAVLGRRMRLLGEDTSVPTRGKSVVVFMEAEVVEGNMRLEVVGSVGRIGTTNRTTMGSVHHRPRLGKTLSHRGIRVTCLATGGATCMASGAMCKASNI
jgi:hypothetical protein